MFKQLKLYYVIVTLPLAMLLVGAAIFFDAIKGTIVRNPHPQINYTIFVIILVGGILIILNVYRLVREARTIVEYSGAIHAKTEVSVLQEMANRYRTDIACLLQMVAASTGRAISHQEQVAIEHELTNARARLNRRNALPQYLTGLLVGMGLLGTFIGLLATLNDISILISSFADLDMGNVDPIQVFRIMIERMKAPMTSMGIAFSASMYGLLGSIILGLMMLGIRRLQGDIFSLLSSEIARHIEIALSYRGVTTSDSGGTHSGEEYKVLVRIEERLAEAARVQQRTLTSELNDFQNQRAEMLRTLTEQTEASNNFRSELQQLGRQLGNIFTTLEKGNSEVSTQLSELTIHLTGDAKETHKLLAMQVEEQKNFRDAIDSYKIEEKLTEAIQLQQRVLTADIEDFKNQRADMLRTLAEQTEASNSFRSELQQLGRQLGNNFNVMEKGSSEIFTQLSALTVHLSADAKDAQKLLAIQVEEQKQLRETLDSYKIDERLTEATRLQQRTLTSGIEDFQNQRADMLRTLAEQTEASNNFRSELQQLGRQLGTIANSMEKGNDEIRSQISELMIHMAADAKEAQKLLTMQVNEQQRLRDSLDLRIKGTNPVG
ncbi:MAG: hypothetical protein U1D97_13895 [Desulfuromonadales bacterium]|nr:hypothetical protein [Desulfuromonadales bacterium]